MIIIPATPSGVQLGFDAVTVYPSSITTPSYTSFDHTGGGSLAVVIAVARASIPASAFSASYGGISMTQSYAANIYTSVSFFTLFNPPSGTNSVVVSTNTYSTTMQLYCLTYKGVKSIGSTYSTDSTNQTVLPAASNALYLTSFGYRGSRAITATNTVTRGSLQGSSLSSLVGETASTGSSITIDQNLGSGGNSYGIVLQG